MENEEYTPAEDTFFIAENIEKEKGNSALDVGSGSGYPNTTSYQKLFFCCRN